MIPAWSPCGMAVDMLRSCYRAQMRFWDEGPLVPVDWYFTDRPFVPYYTRFASANFASIKEGFYDGKGEVSPYPKDRPYRKGATVGDAPGILPCGTADQWANGDVSPTSVPVNALNTPLCCFVASIQPGGPFVASLSSRNGVGMVFRHGGQLHVSFGLKEGVKTLPLAGSVLAMLIALRTDVTEGMVADALSDIFFALRSGMYTSASAGSLNPLLLSLATKEHCEMLGASLARTLLGMKNDWSAVALAEAAIQMRTGIRLGEAGEFIVRAMSRLLLAAASTVSDRQLASAVAEMLLSLALDASPLARAASQSALTVSVKSGVSVAEIVNATEKILLSMEASLATSVDGKAADSPKEQAKVAVSMQFASFSMATPFGGCGSLPTVLVCRFGGATGTCASINGQSVTLTWNGIMWSGSFVQSGHTTTVQLQCMTGWKLNSSSVSGGYVFALASMTGSSGPTPNLTGTVTLTGQCAGTALATITRT